MSWTNSLSEAATVHLNPKERGAAGVGHRRYDDVVALRRGRLHAARERVARVASLEVRCESLDGVDIG